MDVGFYLEVQNLPVRQSNVSETDSSSYSYSPFHPIRVKQLMLTSPVQVGWVKLKNNSARQDLKELFSWTRRQDGS